MKQRAISSEEESSFMDGPEPRGCLDREPAAGASPRVRRIAACQPGHEEPFACLTGRERWIVAELVRHKGAPNKVIAYALRISPNTLRNHLASIYAKLGVRRRVELVLYAMERGLGGAQDR